MIWGAGSEDEDEDEEGRVTFGWDVADNEGEATVQADGGDDTRQVEVRPYPPATLRDCARV